MSENTEDFFAGKRPWSIIKDNVLENYMAPYIAKVKTLRKPILLIDAYAGPGIFEDGKPGSPYMMCQKAEQHAHGNYEAIFFNKDKKYHKRLEQVIKEAGWSSSAHPYLGDSRKLLQLLPSVLHNRTVFLYLDPFGLRGCEFGLLEPFLHRDIKLSTEILLTMNMPTVHRLAAIHTEQESTRIRSTRERLTKVFGGEYWRSILSQKGLSAEYRENQLIEAYRAKLKQYLPFTGACPVRERRDTRIKYFIVFASRHEDSMFLLNDIMMDAYFKRMHEVEYKGTLFEEFHWSELPSIEMQSVSQLEDTIIRTISQNQGATRKKIWLAIIQASFMRYRRSEYIKAVQKLVDKGTILCPTSRKTKQLNDECQLYLPPANTTRIAPLVSNRKSIWKGRNADI